MRSDRYNGVLLCTAPCMSVNTLNSIRCAMGSQWRSRSAAVMLRWSRRSIHRTTRAAARCTISSRCSSVPVIPNNAAFPKSSVDVTSASLAAEKQLSEINHLCVSPGQGCLEYISSKPPRDRITFVFNYWCQVDDTA